MPIRSHDQLRSYVSRISRSSGGLEGLRERHITLSEAFVAESTEAPAAEVSALDGLKLSSPKIRVTEELAAAAMSATEKLARDGQELTPIESLATEAIIIPDKRPAFDIVDGDFVANHALWLDLSRDADIHARLRAAIPSIGRIDLPGQQRIPYAGTGFVVGRGLLMTNRHVAEIFATGLGRVIRFRSGWQAAVDFKRELGRPAGPDLEVRGVRMIHPWWDMALLEVPDLDPALTPLRLAVRDARDLAGTRIAVIGYPARDPLRNDPAVQDKLFDRIFQVKRLQPGEIDGGQATASFGKLVQAATHDCSTLGGNSGSAIIELATGEVLGLHFGGNYLDTNFAVPASELARDSRVVNAGVTFVGAAPGGPAPDWLRVWQDIESVDRAQAQPAAAQAETKPPSAPTSSRPQAVTFEVPLRITVELGTGTVLGAAAPAAPAALRVETTERAVEPQHDTDYSNRGGYDADFLGHVRVPMPASRDTTLLAPLRSGGNRLDYQNFSILMHAERRLALITASNITREAGLRQPEPGRGYSRDDLGGLGPHDTERWFEDRRLDSRYQLPDVFYTRDAGAFDKGHIVRREDVTWGRDYTSVVRANGDTFHVTNCSPQVAQFNQSQRGDDNWGDLENLVLSEAAQARLCVFAGPVLTPGDETFVGRGNGGQTLQVRIPSRYWKVIVAANPVGIDAYGFVLEQDLSGVELEFAVPERFRRLQVSLTAIEDATGVDFGEALRAADTWGKEVAEELAARGGLIRIVSLDVTETEQPTPNAGDDEEAEPGTRTGAISAAEAPSDWRVARALLTLRQQVNAKAPRRNKDNDGTIGDAAHAARDSDHNPWVRDGNIGVVTAIDITHDPAGGLDAGKLAEALLASRDRRIKYVIWNRHIASSAAVDGSPAWAWRPYSGKNLHDKHVHISARPEKSAYDSEEAWKI